MILNPLEAVSHLVISPLFTRTASSISSLIPPSRHDHRPSPISVLYIYAAFQLELPAPFVFSVCRLFHLISEHLSTFLMNECM